MSSYYDQQRDEHKGNNGQPGHVNGGGPSAPNYGNSGTLPNGQPATWTSNGWEPKK
jgi:hypothetical protein